MADERTVVMRVASVSARIPSPLNLFFSLLAVLFTLEALVMTILPSLFPGAQGVDASFTDSFLLTVLSAPFLWMLVVRPLRSMALTEVARAETVLQHVVDGVVCFDGKGTIESFNPAAEVMFGYDADEVVGRNVRSLLTGTQDNSLFSLFTDLGHNDPAHISHEEMGLRKSGEPFPLDISVSRLRMDGGWMYIGIVRDVSSHRSVETQLHAANQKLQAIIEASPHAIIALDQEGNTTLWNKAAERLFGWSEEEVIGRPYPSVPEGRAQEHESLRARVLAGQGFTNVEATRWRKDGTPVNVSVSASPMYSPDGTVTGGMSIVADITERKDIEGQLDYLANYDALTGFPNRTLFRDRLSQMLAYDARSRQQVCVMLLDLDHFKVINDGLGHQRGDLLLQSVAGRLSECIRRSDTAARLGGDDFAVIMPNLANTQDVVTVAKKILELFAKPFDVEGDEVFITASIGITLFPLDGDGPDALLKNAESAMYHAKDQGRNNYQFYSSEMNNRVFERLALETCLRHALERDELLLHYQPRVDLETGRVCGMEALVRWQHPDLGLVPPGRFIRLAEESGLIVPIGEWVLRTACRQNKAWIEEGLPPVRVAVNLSALQFRQSNLMEVVAGILEETGLPSSCLELELTESMLMKNAEQTVKTLGALQGMGIHLSIDDFGTGYSSLSYLKRFPIDSLKVDQSFVRDVCSDPDDAIIVKTIIAMAHSLGLKVVAEGVETEAQLAFLREHQCEEMQGYYFSAPMPVAEFTGFMRDGKRLA